MGDPNKPAGEEATEGLDIAELTKTHGIDIASASTNNVIQPLQVTILNLQRLLADPQNDIMGITPFQIPTFSMPTSVNYKAFLSLFSIVMYANSWMRDNAIVVYFGAKGGGTNFGIARLKDKGYWESEAGKHHLQTAAIQIYTVEEYYESATSQV